MAPTEAVDLAQAARLAWPLWCDWLSMLIGLLVLIPIVSTARLPLGSRGYLQLYCLSWIATLLVGSLLMMRLAWTLVPVEAGPAAGLSHWFAAVLLGALVGTSQIVAQYPDAPGRIFSSPAAWIYVAISMSASWVGFLAILLFGWDFGLDFEGERQVWAQALLAGLSSFAILRMPIPVAQHDGKELRMGLDTLMGVLLGVIDKAIDRNQAIWRDQVIPRIMRDFDYPTDSEALLEYCFRLMHSMSDADQTALGALWVEVEKNEKLSNEAKKVAMGCVLVDLVGEQVLERAVQTVRSFKDARPARSLVQRDEAWWLRAAGSVSDPQALWNYLSQRVEGLRWDQKLEAPERLAKALDLFFQIERKFLDEQPGPISDEEILQVLGSLRQDQTDEVQKMIDELAEVITLDDAIAPAVS